MATIDQSREKQKPHLSATQLESYCKCPEAYRRRYLEGEIIPPGIAILKGKGLHGAAETNFRQKIETRTDLRRADIVDAAVAEFDSQMGFGVLLTPDEESRGAAVVLGEAKDDLVSFVEVHAEKQAPEYQPVLVEEMVRIELPRSPRDLLAVIDLADERGIVTDFKTAGRRKSQADADDSVQLSIYSAAYQHKTGNAPSEMRLDVIVKTSRKTDRQVVSTSRSDADLDALANRINAVNHAIDAGSFPPATPGAWWCSPRFCGYFTSCPFVNSERKSLSERNDE